MDRRITRSMGENNWSIHGHETAVGLLQKAASPEVGPRHAYLFLGPRHVGKRTLAQTFARALLCANNGTASAVPCGACRPCKLMDSGNYPDIQQIQPLDKDGKVDLDNGQLRAHQATQIIQDAALSPLNGLYKIFVIQEIQSANPTFANKLLKTLEEPPGHVILCLTASDKESLLPTIVSRCQLLELRALSPETIESALTERWKVDASKAKLLAQLANGRLGWAVQQLSDKNALEKREADLQLLQNLTASGRVERLAFAADLANKRNNNQIFTMLELWLLWWRDVLLAQSGMIEFCCNVDKQQEILGYAQAIPQQVVQQYIHTLRQVETYLRHTTNLRLALDVILLQLPRIPT